MRFILFNPIAFEKWDFRNSLEKGIGGSETSAVMMSIGLAKKGHEVVNYIPVRKDTPREFEKVKWLPLKEVDWKQKGVWILYRCPQEIDKFPPIEKRKDQKVYLLCQDWDYAFTEKQIHNFDKIVVLCKSHAKYLIGRHPTVKDKIWISSNGVRLDLVEEIEKENIKRNPFRIMHASSPDRGLKQALISFKKAKEYVPELEFHVFYGFNNLKKLAKNSKHFQKIIEDLERLLDQPGVTFHGRVSQPDLYREWFKSGMYIYETNFFETSNISSQEAQSMGAVPVFSPIYAQGENIKYGIAIEGDSYESLTQARFAAELVRLATRPQLQEQIRPEMMAWARKRFTWERMVSQWIYEAEGKRKQFEKEFDFPEQLK